MKKIPLRVERARIAGDTAALRAMGRAGARAAHVARQREREFQEVCAAHRAQEAEDMAFERNGDLED